MPDTTHFRVQRRRVMTGTEGSFDTPLIVLGILMGIIVVMWIIVMIRRKVKGDRKARASERREGLGSYYRQLDQMKWVSALDEMKRCGIVTLNDDVDWCGGDDPLEFHLWPDDQIPLGAQALLCAGFLHSEAEGQKDQIGRQVALEVMRVVPQDQQGHFMQTVRARHDDAGELLGRMVAEEVDRARDQQRIEGEMHLLADGARLMQELSAHATKTS